MGELQNIIIVGLGAIFTALIGLAVTYINYLKKKVEEKDIKIDHLHNGFREEVKQDITGLKHGQTEMKQDIKLIKQAMGFKEDK